MRTSMLFLVVLFSTAFSFGQKIKFDDDKAFVDGEAYLNWMSRVMGSEISISGLTAGKEEIFVMYLDYKDPNLISQSNPKGTVQWIEIKFLTLGLKCEIDSRMHKGLLKIMMDNNLYTNGVLNPENAKTFVEKYGTRFSENRPKSSVNVIINN